MYRQDTSYYPVDYSKLEMELLGVNRRQELKRIALIF